MRDSRETLGTVVSVTTYLIGDGDEATARTAIDAAYDEMGGVEAARRLLLGRGQRAVARPRRLPAQVEEADLDAFRVEDMPRGDG